MNELLDYRPIGISDHRSSGYPEVSIKPGVPQSPSIGLDTNLDKALTLLLTDGFDP
jgi:hypothetical protein